MTFSFHAALPLAAQPTSAEFWASPVQGVVASLALVVGAVGVAVILWGAYCAAVRLLGSEMAAALRQSPLWRHRGGRCSLRTCSPVWSS